MYLPAGTAIVVAEPSPAAARTVCPLTLRSKRPGSLAGHSRLRTVSRAGTQLPKSLLGARGVVVASIGPHPQPNRPPAPFAKPPGVPAFGDEQSHAVAFGSVSSFSRSV